MPSIGVFKKKIQLHFSARFDVTNFTFSHSDRRYFIGFSDSPIFLLRETSRGLVSARIVSRLNRRLSRCGSKWPIMRRGHLRL